MNSAHPSSSSRKPWWILPAAGLAAGALALTAATVDRTEPANAEDGELTAPQMRTPGDFSAPVLKIRGEDADDSGSENSSLPGLGPKTMAEIPKDTDQVVVSVSSDKLDNSVETALYERSGDGWTQKLSFTGHNGKAGWKEKRREGDNSTPAGVFTLTDAGGYLPNPGTKMPYTQDKNLRAGAEAAYGQDYTEVFDYVLAIDYNRKKGTPPTDGTRPQGRAPGGGIWLHVDHGSPTHGCVTVTRDNMGDLLKALDPKSKPMIAMGSADFLAE